MPGRMSFSQVLMQVTGGNDPIMNVKEVACVMKVHEQTVYAYQNDRSEPGYSKLVDLAKELDKRGYFGLAMQFMPNQGKGKANGLLDDDVAKMIQLMGKLYEAESKDQYMNTVAQMEQVVRNFRAEWEAR